MRTSSSPSNPLFRELLSATRQQTPAKPVIASNPLVHLHRLVCNQAWSLRHVPEPVVQHRIVVAPRRTKPLRVQCVSATRPFPFRHVDPRVKHAVVVGVRDACMQLSLRAIQRGEMPTLKPSHTRLTSTPIVGVRDAYTRLTLHAIARSHYSLRPAATRVTRHVVVLAAPPKSVFATLLPTTPVQLNHVQPRVSTTPIVGVRDAFHRLAMHAIVRRDYALKATPDTRITSAVVVVVPSDAPKKPSNAALLRRHAPLLLSLLDADADAFEAVRLFQSLDATTRAMIVDLLKL